MAKLIAKFVGTAREFRESLGEVFVEVCKRCDGGGVLVNWSGGYDCPSCFGKGMWVEPDVKRIGIQHE